MTDAPKTIAEMREAAAKVAEEWERPSIAHLIRAIPLPADDAEMVERVARAIREAESRIHALPRRGGPPGKVYTTIARAALSAMRGEP